MLLIKNVLKALAKSILKSLGSKTAATTDALIYKNFFDSVIATLIISNEEMNDFMKIIKSLE